MGNGYRQDKNFWVPGTSQKKIFGYRWVQGTSQKFFLGTDGYRVPARKNFSVTGTGQKKILGTDGYWIPAKFSAKPTPGVDIEIWSVDFKIWVKFGRVGLDAEDTDGIQTVRIWYDIWFVKFA